MLPCSPGSGPYRVEGGEGRRVLCDVGNISGAVFFACRLRPLLCYLLLVVAVHAVVQGWV